MSENPVVPSGGATRAQIRRVALALFAERGYDGASMRDIARAVGIQAASLYHHFTGKEEILWDLTWSAIEELEVNLVRAATTAASESSHDQLRSFVRAHVAFHAEFSQQAKLVNLNFANLERTSYDRALAARVAVEDRLKAILRDGQVEGSLRVPDLRVSTFAVLQMCTGVSAWYRIDGPLTIPELCDLYEDLVFSMLRPAR